MDESTGTFHAVLLAHRDPEALRPLTERTCAALLPVVGKPLIEHAVEALALAGIRTASVVVGPHAEHVERHLGSGERWGLALDYVLTRGDDGHKPVVPTEIAVFPQGDDVGRLEPIRVAFALPPDERDEVVVTTSQTSAGNAHFADIPRRYSLEFVVEDRDVIVGKRFPDGNATSLRRQALDIIDRDVGGTFRGAVQIEQRHSRKHRTPPPGKRRRYRFNAGCAEA